MENRYFRIYNIIFITLSMMYLLARGYLVIASPFESLDINGNVMLTYYGARSLILSGLALMAILLISDFILIKLLGAKRY